MKAIHTKNQSFLASQVVLVVKNLPASAGGARDVGSIPGSGRYPGERNGNPFQYFCLENPMDRGPWWATVHGVAKSPTRLCMYPHLNVKAFLVEGLELNNHDQSQ